MKPGNFDAGEIWRDIPGFAGTYQASTLGRIRKIWPKSGKKTVMRPYTTKRSGSANTKALRVHLTSPDGRRVERTVCGLVAATFLPAEPGKCPVHRNGLHSDNSLDNIVMMSSLELGNAFGARSCRRPVIKIAPDGETQACYPSARAAGRENHMSYQAVMDRCNRKVKNEFALSGCSFRWDD